MPPPVENTTTRGIYLVDKPGSPQTLLVVGGTSPARSTPDYVPLEVMNNVLGGLFSSRINMNLREEHGYTYGGFSAFIYRRGPGLFLAGGGIRTDATAPALHELYKELDHIRSAPPSAEELKLAKGAFSLSLAGLFENSAQTAGTIADLFVYDFPLDYYQKLPAQSDAVTAAEVQRVAEKYIHPDQFVAVGAGDYEKVGADLRKLDLGPVALRDADGNPAKSETAAGQSH
jgi:zinc protease